MSVKDNEVLNASMATIAAPAATVPQSIKIANNTYDNLQHINFPYISMSGTAPAPTHVPVSIGDINPVVGILSPYAVVGPNYDVLSTSVSTINYKYAEDKIINDFKAHVDATYKSHYTVEDEDIQCFDAWIAMGDATPTFRNTALKYLWRYGKKNGNNKQDLMKALHYVLLCLYNDHYKEKK